MTIEIYSPEQCSETGLQYVGNQISAGFPSPAEDYFEPMLDLNKVLIKNPISTFYARVKGFSMQDAGVDNEDLLVIDKSLTYRKGDLAVCFINGEFTLKRITQRNDKVVLMPANKDYEPIVVGEASEFMIWGIVTYVIKKTY